MRRCAFQVVVADSAAIRVAAPGTDWHHTGASVLQADMPRVICASRWDTEDAAQLRLGSKAALRFASFISSKTLRGTKIGRLDWLWLILLDYMLFSVALSGWKLFDGTYFTSLRSFVYKRHIGSTGNPPVV